MESIIGDASPVWNCRLDKSGRIVLPLPLRNAKSLSDGDDLVISIENGVIVIRTFDEAMDRLCAAFSQNIPDDVRLVDELIAQRKVEAAREASDY